MDYRRVFLSRLALALLVLTQVHLVISLSTNGSSKARLQDKHAHLTHLHTQLGILLGEPHHPESKLGKLAKAKGMALADAHEAVTFIQEKLHMRRAGRHMEFLQFEPEKMCSAPAKEICMNPCPNGEPMCEDVKQACHESFCTPLCKYDMFECKIKLSGIFANDENKWLGKYTEALCAEVRMDACGHVLGCCPTDPDGEQVLKDQVENSVIQDIYPDQFLPMPSCAHDPDDAVMGGALCGKCNSDLVVELKPFPCNYPLLDVNTVQTRRRRLLSTKQGNNHHKDDDDDNDSDNMSPSLTELLELEAWLTATTHLNHTKSQIPSPEQLGSRLLSFKAEFSGQVGLNNNDNDDKVNARVLNNRIMRMQEKRRITDTMGVGVLDAAGQTLGEAAAVGLGLKDWDTPDSPDLQGMLTRCKALQKIVKPQLAAWPNMYVPKLCGCAGCCPVAACPYATWSEIKGP